MSVVIQEDGQIVVVLTPAAPQVIEVVAQGPQGPQGPQGIQGVVGPTGPTGPQGAGVQLQGTVATPADLPLEGNTPGDSIAVASTGKIYTWSVIG